MTTPISQLPPPPALSDSPTDFNVKAFALLGALPAFVTEANTQASGIDAAVAAAALEADAAALKAGESLTSANNAALAKTGADSASDAAGLSAASALDSKNAAQIARAGAEVAAEAAHGGIKAYATKAEAAIASTLLPDGADVEVSQDETNAGARTRYKVQAGALVFAANLDQVRLDMAAQNGADLVGYKHPLGNQQRTVMQKAADVLSINDFAGTDADRFAAFNAALPSVVFGVIPGGDYDNATVKNTFSRSTTIAAREAARQKILVGSVETPDTQAKDRVPVWVQKVSKFNAASRFDHMVGGGLFEHMAVGSGVNGSPNEGTWMGLYGNSVLASKNVGTQVAPATDVNGNVIGTTGFAASDFLPGNGRIITALWGYAASPVMTDQEFTNTTDTWSVVGLEINIDQRHESPGKVPYVGGSKGAAAGIYLVNFQEVNVERKSWQFGIAFHGTQTNGNVGNTDPATWSGFHVGIQLDKIKDIGINFEANAEKNKTIGINFPTLHDESNRGYKTAIALGNNKINLGQYYRGDSDPYDLWHNGEQLFWKMGNGVTTKIPMLLSYFGSTGFVQTHKVEFRVGNKMLRIPCEVVDYVG